MAQNRAKAVEVIFLKLKKYIYFVLLFLVGSISLASDVSYSDQIGKTRALRIAKDYTSKNEILEKFELLLKEIASRPSIEAVELAIDYVGFQAESLLAKNQAQDEVYKNIDRLNQVFARLNQNLINAATGRASLKLEKYLLSHLDPTISEINWLNFSKIQIYMNNKSLRKKIFVGIIASRIYSGKYTEALATTNKWLQDFGRNSHDTTEAYFWQAELGIATEDVRLLKDTLAKIKFLPPEQKNRFFMLKGYQFFLENNFGECESTYKPLLEKSYAIDQFEKRRVQRYLVLCYIKNSKLTEAEKLVKSTQSDISRWSVFSSLSVLLAAKKKFEAGELCKKLNSTIEKDKYFNVVQVYAICSLLLTPDLMPQELKNRYANKLLQFRQLAIHSKWMSAPIELVDAIEMANKSKISAAKSKIISLYGKNNILSEAVNF